MLGSDGGGCWEAEAASVKSHRDMGEEWQKEGMQSPAPMGSELLFAAPMLLPKGLSEVRTGS